MKFIDKLKNVFFEEVEEDEEELPQTFARKVENHKKPEKIVAPKVEEKPHLEEKPKIEEKKVNVEEFKKEDNDLDFQIKPRDLIKEKENEKTFPMMFDVEDFLEDKPTEEPKKEEVLPRVENREPLYRREKEIYGEEEKELYRGKREVSYVESVSKPNYSYTKSYYEEKETKGFKPSPIISPIYGILDKNYRKEEVVTKKETRITSSFHKPDLDSIRNKAFGSLEEDLEERKSDNHYEKETRKVYDVNNNKPQVSRVTLADADEYYNDLGLAYNEDYSDASRNNSKPVSSRVEKYSNKKDDKQDDKQDDNLFDLIDIMYKKED